MTDLVAELMVEVARLTKENDKLKLQVWGGEMSEVERLTAELKEEQGAAEDLLSTLRKTEAERDRLLERLAACDDGASEDAAEVTRLRAALEWYCSKSTSVEAYVEDGGERAREALAGGGEK